MIDAFNGTKKLKLNVPGAESSLVPLEPTWTPDGQFILCAVVGIEDCGGLPEPSRVGAMEK